jgi:hypothetical protein
MMLHNKIERAIITALIPFMQGAGFNLVCVFDGEETVKVKTAEEAIEAAFAVDESRMFFQAENFKAHGVLLILGNGEDVISDWNYSEGDPDGFDKHMDAFAAMIEDSRYQMLPPAKVPA